MGAVKLDDTIGTIPALGISYEDAEALKRNYSAARIRMESASRSQPVTSCNAVGIKPARTGSGDKKPAAENDEIIICGHIDSWFCPGAFDNGSGTVMLAELARLLRHTPLPRNLRFTAFGSEELGLMGSKSYAGRMETCAHVHSLINLDVSAVKDGTTSITALGNEKLRRFIQSIVEALHLNIPVTSGVSKHSDHWPFQERGVPCAWTHSGSSYSYSHTEYDTLDKMDAAAFTLPLLLTGAVIIECAMTDQSFR
jgi:aminopeptidase YwaD